MSSGFNLSAPPGFRALHPDIPVRIYHRHLPHWRQDEATYFVTFRLCDSIPQEQLRALRRWRDVWERHNPEPRNESQFQELAREITSKTEVLLDQGYGRCYFRDRSLAAEFAKSLLYFQDQRWQLSCFTIMPNHVHLVAKPLGGYELEDVLGSVKNFISGKIHAGTIWEQESHDRIARDEEHLWRCVQYIGRNPEKAGLQRETWVRWIHPEWERLGWRFLN